MNLTTLYGPDGSILSEEARDPALRGGWREGLPWDGGFAQPDAIYGVDRDRERLRTRRAYFQNPLFGSAVDIAVAFLVGDEFSYAPPNIDQPARTVLDEFWAENDLGALVGERLVTEYLLDGETCAVFPTGDEDPGTDTPARIALLDVGRGVRLRASITGGVEAVTTAGANAGTDLTWERGQFVWAAHAALWNDPRGWPVAMRAVEPAAAYLTLLNHRLNTHELQARILGVQKVFVDRERPDSRAQFAAKAGAYRSLPRRGGVLTLPMVEGKDGKVISDSLDFMTPGKGGADAATDARALMRLTGLALGGLPEHWLGEGGNATRTTAGEMSLPAVRIALRRQAVIRGILDRLVRAELTRRLGAGRKYTLTTWDYRDDGRTRVKRTRKVPVSQLEIPWVLPAIRQDTLADLLSRAEAAAKNGWASPQTLAASLGFDPGEEDTRMAAVGLAFGQANGQAAQPTAPTGGDANATDPSPV